MLNIVLNAYLNFMCENIIKLMKILYYISKSQYFFIDFNVLDLFVKKNVFDLCYSHMLW